MSTLGTSNGSGSTNGTPNIVNQPAAGDPWALSQQGYQREKLYTRSTDGQGHSATLYSKVSPALMHEIQALIQSRAIPELRTIADVVRDALIHRLHDYRDMLPPGALNLGHAIAIEMRQAELDKIKADREAWERLIEDVDARLHDLIKTGEYEEARWVIEQNETIDSMSDAYLTRLTKVLDDHRHSLASIPEAAI